jgi:hypothetical protein
LLTGAVHMIRLAREALSLASVVSFVGRACAADFVA